MSITHINPYGQLRVVHPTSYFFWVMEENQRTHCETTCIILYTSHSFLILHLIRQQMLLIMVEGKHKSLRLMTFL